MVSPSDGDITVDHSQGEKKHTKQKYTSSQVEAPYRRKTTSHSNLNCVLCLGQAISPQHLQKHKTSMKQIWLLHSQLNHSWCKPGSDWGTRQLFRATAHKYKQAGDVEVNKWREDMMQRSGSTITNSYCISKGMLLSYIVTGWSYKSHSDEAAVVLSGWAFWERNMARH